jgi:hypothetical protein
MQRDSEIEFNSNRQESHSSGREALAMSRACNLLLQAGVRTCNPLSNGSNYIFLTTMVQEGTEVKAIYKPRLGEFPLWDFPDGTLYKREYAAFVVSQALEWHLVPPTVIRDGPHGIGSMQWFIETVIGARPYLTIKDTSVLKQVALFDYLINNADRKVGHFLQDKGGRLWLVDHGLTFNEVPKLRTVLWDFSGETIPDELLEDVKALQSKLRQERELRATLRHLLEESEVEALEFRTSSIIKKPVFVYPGPHRSVPWPWF